jgi:hypothetical protein
MFTLQHTVVREFLMNPLRKYPFHTIALAIFPILSLLATNISEVDDKVAIRPLFIAVAGAILLLVMVSLVIKNIQKAAIIVSLVVVFFFSYGHLYQIVKNAVIFGVTVGRHRYLVPILIIILLISMWFVIKRQYRVGDVTQVMNVVSIALLIYPSFQIIRFNLRTQSGIEKLVELPSTVQRLQVPDSGDLPDIYYIVLDTYTREDALRRDFGFDNSPFLNELRDMGFYVGDCSRSNYSYTQPSITSALNMNYLPDLQQMLEELGLDKDDIWALLKQSLVRRLLEEIGYKTVAFETGYEWSRIRDADIYLAVDKDPITIQRLDPFESMLTNTTLLVIFSHLQIQDQYEQTQNIEERVRIDNFPYAGYAERQLFILDKIPEISELEEPTFAIVHLLIPHVPYVFDPNGEIWSDPGFYSGERAEPINEWYWQKAYTSEIQFIDQRMTEIFKEILNNSKIPPIIVMHGDHGLRGENRLQILNVYYLPDDAKAKLYRNISPVNSFRVIFDNYFGTDYGLLPDLSYYADEKNPRPETSQECILE